MLKKIIGVICICLATFPLCGQVSDKYQVATITEVKTHQGDSGVASYDVSVRVGKTIYVVLYTPPLGTTTVKYAAGHELLVRVDKKTITYSDILGQSFDVPIISQRSVAELPK